MGTISKIMIAGLLAVTLWSCGPGSVVVSTQPAPPVYVRPAMPHPGWVWVDGDYYYRGGRYVYRQGYWAAPRQGRVWMGGGWERRNNGYYWRRGHWR